jgi:hypothetical protein
MNLTRRDEGVAGIKWPSRTKALKNRRWKNEKSTVGRQLEREENWSCSYYLLPYDDDGVTRRRSFKTKAKAIVYVRGKGRGWKTRPVWPSSSHVLWRHLFFGWRQSSFSLSLSLSFSYCSDWTVIHNLVIIPRTTSTQRPVAAMLQSTKQFERTTVVAVANGHWLIDWSTAQKRRRQRNVMWCYSFLFPLSFCAFLSVFC